MKFLVSTPVMMRMVVLLFMVGFVLGISLGYRLGDVDHDDARASSPSDTSSWSLVSLVAEEVEQLCTPTSSSL
jgi:hypothetical protein